MTKRVLLPISFKLLFLAGIPVIGALLLGLMLAHEAQQQARSAEALGTIEDLARLSATMSNVVHAVQDERALTALELEQSAQLSNELSVTRATSDTCIAKLDAFLALRSIGSLPTRLSRDLAAAMEALKALSPMRKAADERNLTLAKLLEQNGRITGSLINATAGLTQLANDGELLRNITILVAALEVGERMSREQALLANVLGAKHFPPGSFREFVTLTSEQQVYLNVLRSSATDTQIRELETVLSSPAMRRAAEMRSRAQQVGDNEDVDVRAEDWFRVEKEILRDIRRLETDVAAKVKDVAVAKIAGTRAAVRASIGLSVSVLCGSVLLALLIGRGISRSVKALAQAARDVRTNNDFSVRAVRSSSDELGMLTDAFNGMLEDILTRDEELKGHRHNLEMLVRSRTEELAQRNREMRIVLDAVEQGLVTVLPDGSLGTQQSQAFGAWFPNSAGRPFFEVLAPDERTQLMLKLGWEAVVEQFLPLELCLDQLMRQLVVGDRHYALAYRPILEGEQLLAVLLSVSDITAEVARRRSEAQQGEFVAVFERAMKDKNGFIEFFNEATRLVEAIDAAGQTEDVVLLRQVHTLKGNSGVFGVSTIAALCHEFETLAQDEGVGALREQLPRLVEKWAEFSARIVPLLGTRNDDVIEVHHDDLESIIAQVKQLPHAQAVALQMTRWKYEPTTIRFERAAEQAKAFARRLGKGSILCVIDGGGVRLPAERWGLFFQSLIHVVRNAVDHGLEPEAERVAAGKSPVGTLSFRSRESGGNFTIEVEDDGRGVDWSKIGDRAVKMGLPSASQADLVRALFADGITTRETATEYSGRGVGMAAVEQAVLSLSGRIDVTSQSGKGTLFTFTFPVAGNDQAPADSRFPGARPSVNANSRFAQN
ncbi:MAG TPA: nitrate- and nitrite sensing domain-containing protein [Polyangiaceae bacterium]